MPNVLDIILFLVTISGSVFLVSGMIEFKYSKKTRLLVLIPVCLLALAVTILFASLIPKENPFYYIEILIVNIFIALTAILIMAKDDVGPVMFTIVTQIDVLMIICYVSLALSKLFGDHVALEILFRMIGFLIMTIFYKFVLKDKYRRFVKDYKETKGWLLVLLIPLGYFGIYCSTLLYPINIFQRAIHAHNVMAISILAMAATYFGIFYAFDIILEKNKIKDDAVKTKAKLILWQNQLDNQEEKIEATRKTRHNLRHHDAMLLKFLEDGEVDRAIEYLKKHIENSELDKPIRYCLNYTINSLLTIYVTKAEKNNIVTKCEARVDKELKIDDIKLTNVIANLLENAIEACLKLEKEEHKFIDIEVLATDQNIKILVRNSCLKNIEFDEENFPVSTKEIKSGIGTRNVASIVEENNGFVDYSEKDGVFEARVVINY